MGNPASRGPNRGGRVLFLDVHVKSVQGYTTGLGIKPFDDFEGLFHGVDQACLVSVQGFDAQLHLTLFGVLDHGPERFHQAVDRDLAFVR